MFFEDLYESRQRGVFDKSREVGATWLFVAFLVKYWIFSENFKGTVGSRVATDVDSKGDPDCIFEKVRQLIRLLPMWIQPPDWELKNDKLNLIRNPVNGSVISGKGGKNMGRGGRSSIYFLDEAAHIENSKSVIAALSRNSDCLIQVSTPNGTNNEFYRAVTSGAIPRISLHWKDDPRRNHWVAPDGSTGNGWDCPAGAIYPWYDKQVRELDPHTVAQELDLDYTSSVIGIYIPAKWVMAAVDAHLKIPAIADGNQSLAGGLDVATEGSNQSVFISRRGAMVESIESWQGIDTTQSAHLVHNKLVEGGYKHLVFDADGVGAGVAGTLAAIYDKPYSVETFHGAGTPSEWCYWEGEQKTSKQKFRNKRAEAWGLLRERFKKTFETIENIESHPPDELISIPNDGTLIIQISQPTVKYDASGKILIESKQDLRKRGLSSPDHADALVYAFYPPTNLDWLNSL